MQLQSASFFLFQFQNNLMFCILDKIALRIARLCSIEKRIASGPDRHWHIIDIAGYCGPLPAIAFISALPFFFGWISIVAACSGSQILIIPLIPFQAADIGQSLAHIWLHKHVIIKTHISMQDRHKAGNIRTVRTVDRRIARRIHGIRTILGASSDSCNGSVKKIMHKSNSL